MKYFVYFLVSVNKKKIITYVGYTSNLKNRLLLHNSSRGAKFTRGKKWIVFYKKVYKSKSAAMSNEYKLKKNRKFRNFLREKYIKMSKIKKNHKNKI